MAAKLSQKAASWIRNVFTREQEVRRDLGPKRPYFDPSGRDFNLLSLYGYDVVGDYLKLDHDLFSRYYDYEEMDDYPDASAALDVYADDATQVDSEERATVWIESDDEQIARRETEMLKRCRAEEITWEMTRSLCKYGNDYEEVLVSDEGVQSLAFMPPATVRRIEGPRSELVGFVQSYTGDFTIDPNQFGDLMKNDQMQGGKDGVLALEGWRVLHMRLRGKYRGAMYGHSILDPARWIWKRLVLMEDAVLIYKLTRSPSRLAFYVDTGRLQGDEAWAYVNKVAQAYKKRKFVNPKTGRLDLQFNPLGMDDDFFLPVNAEGRGTKIDMLNGPTYQSMEDVDHFLKKFYAAIKVPRAYLGYDENMPSKATLSQEDVRFARTVLRCQREVCNGWKRVGEIDLAATGTDPAYIDFAVRMTVPSSIFELGQMEVKRLRAELGNSLESYYSMYWVMSKVLHMSDEDIRLVMRQKEQEQFAKAAAEARAQRIASGAEPYTPEPVGPRAEPEVPQFFRPMESRNGTVGMGPVVYRPRNGRFAGMNSVITEDELTRGNRQHEREDFGRVEGRIASNPRLVKRVDEVHGLLRELADTIRSRRAA